MRLYLLMVGILAVLAPLGARAETIYVDEANPPFMYREGDRAAGIYPDLIREIFERANLPVSIEAVPWKRALENVEQGKGAIGGVYKTRERKHKFLFSDPIYAEHLMIYQRADSFTPVNAIGDLFGKTVGIIRGWSYGDAFDAARGAGKFQISPSASDDQNLKMLALGRVDMVIAIRAAGDKIVKRLKLEQTVRRNDTPILENPTYIALNRHDPWVQHLPLINKAIAEIRTDGTWKKIVDHALNRQAQKIN